MRGKFSETERIFGESMRTDHSTTYDVCPTCNNNKPAGHCAPRAIVFRAMLLLGVASQALRDGSDVWGTYSMGRAG